MTDTTVKGLSALQAALDQLPAKIEANILRGALRAGAKVLAEEIKRNVPERTGALAQSIKFGAKLDKRDGKVSAYARAGGRGKKGKPGVFYAHMVEFGTAAHIIQAPPGARLAVRGVFYSSVQHPGARKRPFVRPALDAKATAATQAVAEYIRTRLATKHGINVPAPLDSEAEDE